MAFGKNCHSCLERLTPLETITSAAMTFLDVLDEVYPRSNDNADNVDAAYALWFDGYICMNDGLVESPESADLIEPVISEPFGINVNVNGSPFPIVYVLFDTRQTVSEPPKITVPVAFFRKLYEMGMNLDFMFTDKDQAQITAIHDARRGSCKVGHCVLFASIF